MQEHHAEILAKRSGVATRENFWRGSVFFVVSLSWVGTKEVAYFSKSVEMPSGFHTLTIRERDILLELGGAGSIDQASQILRITPNTARRHVESIRSKMGFDTINDVRQLARFYLVAFDRPITVT